MISDWLIHTPREVLAKNWGVQESALAPLKSIPPEGRYIFQTAVPGPLDEDRQKAAQAGRLTKTAFEFRTAQLEPQKKTKMGAVRIVDSSNFPEHVTLKPGGLRELHWHPNADEWQYYLAGNGRMTLFHNRATANTACATRIYRSTIG